MTRVVAKAAGQKGVVGGQSMIDMQEAINVFNIREGSPERIGDASF